MIQILSLLDAIAGLSILIGVFFDPYWWVLLYPASYLVVKAIIFHTTWVSWVDGIIGVWMIMLLLGISNTVLSAMSVLWLFYKAVIGFMTS